MCQGLTNTFILVFRMTRLLFSLFSVIPCIFDRNLINLLKFHTKLTLVKDRSFPHLRIHLLCTDHLFLDLI